MELRLGQFKFKSERIKIVQISGNEVVVEVISTKYTHCYTYVFQNKKERLRIMKWIKRMNKKTKMKDCNTSYVNQDYPYHFQK